MGYLAVAVTTIMASVIESTWPVPLYWRGERPEVLVAAVLSAGAVFGARWGLTAGFFAALLRGALEHQPLGGLFIGYMAVGWAAGTVGYRLLVRRAVSAVPAAAICVVLFRFLVLICQPPASFVLWLAGTFFAAIYTMLAAIPIHALALWMFGLGQRAWAPWR